ncbi:MAG: T9SS type A sorting domain-containing protein [Bacteroidetes bacterium]|nr:T9SS type A sorting domain-containing protein [Bacteroidota bacterium]
MLRYSCFLLCAFALLPLGAGAQQDPMIVPRSGESGSGTMNAPVLSNPDMRAQYFHDRVTYPGGSIPEGARVRAWNESREKLPLFAPRGKGALQDAMQWENMGPANIGGRIITVAVNPKNAATVFIGAAGGGIWRSYDAGLHWQSVSDDLPTQALGAIAIDPVDTNVVYAGTGEASYAQRTFDGGGMFKSTDGGTNWFEIGQGTLPPYARASDLVIDPTNTSTLFAAIPDGVRNADSIGIYRSRDAGATWSLILTGRMSDIVINPRNPAILYTHSSAVFGGGTAQRYGMHKSTDGGDSWFKLDVGMTDSLMGRTSIGICDAQPDVLYIGVSDITGNDVTPLLGVFKTTDGGAQWTKLDVPFDYMASQGWYDNIMGVHPENPDIVYAGGVKIIFSTDGGASWTRVPDQGYGGIVHVDQHAIAFNPEDPSQVYLGNDGGFFVGSNDGKDWEKRDKGLSITQFIGGAMHPSSDAVLFGGTQDNGTLMSTDAPDFTLALYGDGGNGAINPMKPQIMYTTKETLKFYRSDDFGSTWTKSQRGLGLDRSLFYIDFAMDPNNPDMLYLGTSKLYKSTNGGLDWTLKNSCLVPTAGGCYYISALSVAPYDGSLVMAGGTGGGVAISRDAGENWTVVETGTLPLGYCSSVRSFRPGILYATYSRYGIDKVWRSVDTGSTWKSINADLPDIPVNDLIELDGKIILGSDLGAFISADDGVSWQRLGTGMPAISVQRFAFSARTGTLRAFTHGRGMYDLRWTQPMPLSPVFATQPDRDTLDAGEMFVYAAVVDASPDARFRLRAAPAGASVDSVLGIVRWAAEGAAASFSLEAWNVNGASAQDFSLTVRNAAAAEWEIVQPQPLSTAVNAAACAAPAVLWLARDSALVSRSTDGGVSWTHHALPGINAQVLDVHAFDGERAVVGTRSGHIMKTTDGGTTWVTLLSTVNERYGNIFFHDEQRGVAITPDPDNQRKGFAYLTSDGGATWVKSEELPTRFPIDNTLTFLDENNGWFASSNTAGSDPSDASIFRTTDGGTSWIEVAIAAQNVSAISFADAQRGFCVDDVAGFVRRSINGGGSWRAAFYPMNGRRNVDVQSFAGSDIVWVINDESAWFSGDLGSSWKRTTLSPCGSVQDAVFIDTLTGWIVSKAGIVQRLRGNPLLSTAGTAKLPDGMRLEAAWPNPVAVSVVMLPFALAHSETVTLRIFNSAGREIAVPLRGTVSAGEHAVAFDAADLPDGVYFYTLQSGTQLQSRRFIRMR